MEESRLKREKKKATQCKPLIFTQRPLSGWAGKCHRPSQSCRKHTLRTLQLLKPTSFCLSLKHSWISLLLLNWRGCRELFLVTVWLSDTRALFAESLFSPWGPVVEIISREVPSRITEGPCAVQSSVECTAEKPAVRLLPPGGDQECLRDKHERSMVHKQCFPQSSPANRKEKARFRNKNFEPIL